MGVQVSDRITIEAIFEAVEEALLALDLISECKINSESSSGVCSTFEDALHALAGTARPLKRDLQQVCGTVLQCVQLAGVNVDSWKAIVLTIILRRFHAKAPESKRLHAATDPEDSDSFACAEGDGERLIFALAFWCLLRFSTRNGTEVLPSVPTPESPATAEVMAGRAARCLVSLAVPAGGSRDVCRLLELASYDALARGGYLATRQQHGHAHALRLAACAFAKPDALASHAHLDALANLAATMLDGDLAIVRKQQAAKAGNADVNGHADDAAAKTAIAPTSAAAPDAAERPPLMSTIHTFLPHNDRGSSRAPGHRKLAQCVAEMLVWSRTGAATNTSAFAAAKARLVAMDTHSLSAGAPAPTAASTAAAATASAAAPAAADSQGQLIDGSVHAMQTTARRLRQRLGREARTCGFSLCTQYLLDRSALTLSHVRRGKAGDLTTLRALASKAADTRTLRLLAMRARESKRAVAAASVEALAASWQPLPTPKQGGGGTEGKGEGEGEGEGEAAGGADETQDELEALNLQLQEATVRATLRQLRAHVRADERSTLVASNDGAKLCRAAAVLVAAAMHPQLWLDDDDGTANGGAKAGDGNANGEAKAGDANGGAKAGDGNGGGDNGEVEAKRQRVDVTAPPGAESSCDAPVRAAAPRLLLPSADGSLNAEQVDVSTLADVMSALDRVFTKTCAQTTSARAGGGAAGDWDGDASGAQLPAATKELQNLIARHLREDETLLLLASSDVSLPETTLKEMQLQRQTVHCHVADEMNARLQREGARIGDVTVSLMWNTRDDLDLHVITPSGDEISYRNKLTEEGCLDVDMNASGGQSSEPVENVFLGDAEKGVEAPRGSYRVVVQNYAYHTPPPHLPVEWTVHVRANDVVTRYSGSCTGMNAASDVVVCTFEYAGRTAPPPSAVGSALEASNLVAVTSSTGSTIDALRQLVSIALEHTEIERVRELTFEAETAGDAVDENTERAAVEAEAPTLVPEEGGADSSAAAAASAESGADADDDADAGAGANSVADASMEATRAADADAGAPRAPRERAVMAPADSFDVSSRARLRLQLSRLPPLFHATVEAEFGGRSLLELSSAAIAKRMVRDAVHVEALRDAGYPTELVGHVKELMQTSGRGAAE